MDLPDVADLRAEAHVVSLPLVTRFRGVDHLKQFVHRSIGLFQCRQDALTRFQSSAADLFQTMRVQRFNLLGRLRDVFNVLCQACQHLRYNCRF